MKAIICTKYGPPEVLQISEIERPAPGKNEVLIKIYAANVTISDCIVRSGKVNLILWLPMRIFVGFKRPRKSILGLDLSGEVEAIGSNVKRFKKGDHVIAFTGKNFGAYAEYVCLPENGKYIPSECVITEKPSNITWEEAAAIPSRGMLALHYLKKANIQNGQKILIYGSSGGVGTYAIQIAKNFGAHVTGVCKRYSSKLQYKKVLTPNGKFISVDDGHPKIYIDELTELKNLTEAGKLITVIDKIYPLEQTGEAYGYVEKGHKKGNVVIKIN